MKIVTFKDVSEKYRIKFIVNGKDSWEDFWALKTVNFSVDKGQTLAIIGENGAGKSTILKLIAGMLKADKGEVRVQGRVAALLELGAGFHPEFTGRENLYLNASLFGLSRQEINTKFDEIVEFSGIGRFIDAQVKSYSQGMFVRLAFAIAIHINPDILLIDDSLSVGDEDFQKKCVNKILELKKTGKTIIFVTHNMNMAKRLCKEGIFLRSGEIISEGPIDTVISCYMETLGDKKGIAIIRKDALGVVFNNGRLIVRWQDKTITQDQGVYSSFFFEEYRFNSSTGNWRAEVKNASWVVAKGEWFNVPVVQIWDIRLLDDGQLQLKVSLEISDKSRVENFQMELLFSEEYDSWFSLDREGVFPEKFFHERECELIHEESADKLVGLKGSDKENGAEFLPSLIIDAFDLQTEALCQILNSGQDVTARIIRLKFPVLYERVEDSVDAWPSLTMKIKFIASKQQDTLEKYMYSIEQLIKEERQKFEKKKMELRPKKFLFGNNRFSICTDENNFLHMYNGEKKLTSGRGITTFLRIGNDWKQSVSRKMWIKKIAENHIQAYNIAWIHAPAVQTWSFVMREEGVVEVTMAVDVQSSINIHELLVGIFFSQSYTKWFTISDSGNISDSFKLCEEIPSNNKEIKAIGLTAANLPAIVLDVSADLKYSACIHNSNFIFEFPVLQAVTEGVEYRKGKFEFFKGIIRIIDEKDIVYETSRHLGTSQEAVEAVFDKENPGDSALYLMDGQKIEPQNSLVELQQIYSKGRLGIAVSRFNFFKLDSIIKFYADIFKRQVDLGDSVFNPFPVKTIFSNFVDYIRQIKSAADALGIRLVLKDKALPELLKTVSLQANAYNGKDLLRLLGVICEHAFIGPKEIIVDLFHRCNASCVHCWFHNPNAMLPEEHLDMRLGFDMYKKIVDDAQALSVALILFEGKGEPLLDQSFPKMAAYAKDKGIPISFSTNGLLFSQDTAKKTLLDFYVETITCSLPAATEDTYALINPKLPKAAFHEVVRNISYFIELRNNFGLKKPLLQMNHVIHTLNCHELMQMAELDAKIGADIVQFCIMQKPDKNMAHLKLSSNQINVIKDSFAEVVGFLKQRGIVLDDNFLLQLKYYSDNAEIPLKYDWNKDMCPIGWLQSSVSANAEVSMCQLKVVGRLTDASFKEIWDSGEYHSYRIKAKHLKDNRDVTFMNGTKLCDERCESCDIMRALFKIDSFSDYNLDKFI